MGRGKSKKLEQVVERNKFLRGETKSLRIKVEPSKKLGYSPAQVTASGSGTHGGGKKTRNKRDRRTAKKDLRNLY